MGERWSADAVAALAGDAASLAAARRLGGAWSGTGTVDELVWGACRGSGKEPYRTCVDLSGPAYRCSCPSRKFPCKHALALLLVWSAGEVPAGEPPGWAAEWVAARGARAGSAPRSAPTAATRERRDRRAADGLAELERWLADQVRGGLAVLQQGGYGPVDALAARMVDAQLPGVAGTVRRLPAVARSGPGWPARLLDECALLHLLARAHDDPDPALASTVRGHLGIPVPREEVLAGPAVSDTWVVIGSRDTEEDRLTVRRVWLAGRRTGREALVLSFAAGDRPLDGSLVAGTEIDADLHFHPGAAPLRALVGERRGEARPATALPAGIGIGAALERWSAALAADPWTRSRPAVLAGIVPIATATGWVLADGSGAALPVAGGAPWTVVAASGGAPVDLLVEILPGAARPVALLLPGPRVVPAAPTPGADGPAPDPVEGAPIVPEIVTSALLGTARRPLDPRSLAAFPGVAEQLAGRDPARALLDAAALATVATRAGRRPASAPARPDQAPTESDAAVPAPAGRRLARLLTRPDGDLLPLWLAAVRQRGLRVPPEHLPALLDAAADRPGIAADLGAVGGARLAWLGSQHPGWAALGPAPELPANAWEHGDARQRRAWLRRARPADPDAARRHLAAAWPGVPPAERAGLLAELGPGLAAGDEDFLESCLDERRREVREQAAELLRLLPGSALAQRWRDRATRAVRLESGALVVTAPDADPALLRDGLPPYPGRGGERAWLLGELLAVAPLDTWVPALGTTPAEVLARPVDGERRHLLHDAWVRAAIAQHDVAWIDALLTGAAPAFALRTGESGVAALVGALPVELRGRRVAALVGDDHRPPVPPLVLDALLDGCPAPWPTELARAVLHRIAQGPDQLARARVLALLGLRAAPGLADAVAALAAARDPGSPLARHLAAAAHTLRTRATMLEELDQ